MAVVSQNLAWRGRDALEIGRSPVCAMVNRVLKTSKHSPLVSAAGRIREKGILDCDVGM